MEGEQAKPGREVTAEHLAGSHVAAQLAAQRATTAGPAAAAAAVRQMYSDVICTRIAEGRTVSRFLLECFGVAADWDMYFNPPEPDDWPESWLV